MVATVLRPFTVSPRHQHLIERAETRLEDFKRLKELGLLTQSGDCLLYTSDAADE